MKLCKFPAHMGIKWNERTVNATKQAIDMPRMTTTRLPHIYSTNCSLGGIETPSDKGNGKTVLVSYTTLKQTSKSGKVLKTAVGNTRSNWVGYGLDTLD